MSGRRYIVTVDRALLEQTPWQESHGVEPIRVEDTTTGRIQTFQSAELVTAKIVYGPPRQDGARVWIECANVVGYRS